MIRRSFEACGIGLGELDVSRLSQPLKELFEVDFDAATWEAINSNLATGEEFIGMDELQETSHPESSLYECLHNILSIDTPYEFWFHEIVKNCIDIVKEKWTDFASESDLKIMETGKVTSGVEILALCELIDSEITETPESQTNRSDVEESETESEIESVELRMIKSDILYQESNE